MLAKSMAVDISDKKITLGQLLRKLREDKGLKQMEVADNIGVKRVTYSAYETDRIVPPADKLYKIAGFYRISVGLLASKTVNGKVAKTLDQGKDFDEMDLTTAEMMYYYQNLDEAKKKLVFELIKALYSK